MSVIPIIIPSYEPDDRFLELLAALRRAKISPIIVVNDGSSSAYQKYFDAAEKDFGAVVLTHEKNLGKGRGLKTAFTYCLENFAEMTGCVTADSDGQHTPAAIEKCRAALTAHPENLILGTRSFDNAAEIPLKSQLGNILTRKVFKILYGVDISDTQTGLRAIPVDFMRAVLNVPGDRFEFETNMLISAIKSGVRIETIPIETIYDSKENHSTHFRPVADSLRIYWLFRQAFARFVLSSMSAAAIDLGLFQLFCALLKNYFSSVGYIFPATVLARIISATYNHTVNYFLVFNGRRKYVQSAARYFCLAAVQGCVSAALTAAIFSVVESDLELFVKIPVDIALFFVNYFVQKNFVY